MVQSFVEGGLDIWKVEMSGPRDIEVVALEGGQPSGTDLMVVQYGDPCPLGCQDVEDPFWVDSAVFAIEDVGVNPQSCNEVGKLVPRTAFVGLDMIPTHRAQALKHMSKTSSNLHDTGLADRLPVPCSELPMTIAS